MSKPKLNQTSALQKLRNFCAYYNLRESDELLTRTFLILLAGNYSKQTIHTMERVLDYFDALESLLPALYELRDGLKDPGNEEGEEDTFQNRVLAKDLFASFKRHPE